MKVLLVCPEETYNMPIHTKIPKRWAYVVEVATYINSQKYDVKVMDCLDPKVSHGEVFKELASTKYKVVLLVARFESTRSILKMSSVIKKITPTSKVVVYGDVISYAQNLFKCVSIDAIIENGDWECGIIDYLKFIDGKITEEDIGGVSFRIDGTWRPAGKGKQVQNNLWSLPQLEPKFVDNDLYLSLADRELTITVSKGCPFNCHFCHVVMTEGKEDRRKKPKDVVDYIIKHKHLVNKFKLFSPTLTLDVEWVKELCNLLIKSNCCISWSATTRPNCLKDEEMVRLMSESGCYKISIGVETLDNKSTKKLGKYSDVDIFTETKNAVILLKRYGIKVKTLMMLGIEGQSADNIYETFELLEEWGAEIRATSYSPRETLKQKDEGGILNVDYIEDLDKMTYQHIDIPGVSTQQFLELIYNTSNFRKILKK